MPVAAGDLFEERGREFALRHEFHFERVGELVEGGDAAGGLADELLAHGKSVRTMERLMEASEVRPVETMAWTNSACMISTMR